MHGLSFIWPVALVATSVRASNFAKDQAADTSQSLLRILVAGSVIFGASDLRLSPESLLGAEGHGLTVAKTTFMAGRHVLPACSLWRDEAIIAGLTSAEARRSGAIVDIYVKYESMIGDIEQTLPDKHRELTSCCTHGPPQPGC